jgi:hypothetical protein
MEVTRRAMSRAGEQAAGFLRCGRHIADRRVQLDERFLPRRAGRVDVAAGLLDQTAREERVPEPAAVLEPVIALRAPATACSACRNADRGSPSCRCARASRTSA